MNHHCLPTGKARSMQRLLAHNQFCIQVHLSGILVTMTEDAEDQLPCAEKLAFDTREQANAAGTAADWQYGASLKAYKCRYCHLWHLSSQPDD